MEQVLQLAVVFLAALAAGGLMVNWLGLARAMSRLSVATYVEFHQATNRHVRSQHADCGCGCIIGWYCARDSFSRDSFAFQGIGYCWNCLLCRSTGGWLAYKRPDEQTDRALVRSKAAPTTARAFATLGFGFTLSALFFRFLD
jgi:hypothetical protein